MLSSKYVRVKYFELEAQVEKDPMFKSGLVSVNRGGQIPLIIIKSLLTASHHFGLSIEHCILKWLGKVGDQR